MEDQITTLRAFTNAAQPKISSSALDQR